MGVETESTDSSHVERGGKAVPGLHVWENKCRDGLVGKTRLSHIDRVVGVVEERRIGRMDRKDGNQGQKTLRQTGEFRLRKKPNSTGRRSSLR